MMASSLGASWKWVHCKHLYFILQKVMHYGQTKKIIHFPTWSWNEMQRLMSRAKMVVRE
jgi:hypothetical protein